MAISWPPLTWRNRSVRGKRLPVNGELKTFYPIFYQLGRLSAYICVINDWFKTVNDIILLNNNS